MNYEIVIFCKHKGKAKDFHKFKIQLHCNHEKAFNHAEQILKSGFRTRVDDSTYDWISPYSIERVRVKSIDHNQTIIDTSFGGVEDVTSTDDDLL